jgi:hypothetical protein
MTTTGRRIHDPESLPEIPLLTEPGGTREAPPSHRRSLTDHISTEWIAALAVAWPVLLTIILALEPVADDPEAVPAGIEAVFAAGFTIAIIATLFGGIERRRYAYGASLIAAGILAVGVAACPASGHHAYGAWWLGQVAAVGGLVGLSWAGLRRADRRPSPHV